MMSNLLRTAGFLAAIGCGNRPAADGAAEGDPDTDLTGDTDPSAEEPFTPGSFDLSGVAQKGPFLPGAKIVVFELDASLQQTGRSFFSTVTSNDGHWSVPGAQLASPYVLVTIDGEYFNESDCVYYSDGEPPQGGVATGSLAVVQDIRLRTEIGLNLMAHIERPRIEALVRGGQSFGSAALQAHTEFSTAVGFDPPAVVATALDLFGTRPDDAALVVLSSNADGFGGGLTLSETLQRLGDDMADGTLTAEHVGWVQRAVAGEMAFGCSGMLGVATCLEEQVADGGPIVDRVNVQGAMDAVDGLLSRCVDGHLDCDGLCVLGESAPEAVTRVTAAGVCDGRYACDDFAWDWVTPCGSPRVDPNAEETQLVSAWLCEPGTRLTGFLEALWSSVLAQTDVDLSSPTGTAAERRAAGFEEMCPLIEDGSGDCLDNLSDAIGVRLTSNDDICVDENKLGDGVCDPLFDDRADNWDLGDCLGGPAVDPPAGTCPT